MNTINVVGALAFVVGFILTAALLPAYLRGSLDLALMLLPPAACALGAALFVVTQSDVDDVSRRLGGNVPTESS